VTATSHGNFVAAVGHPVLDGFGAVGDGAHVRHEHISVDGVLERTTPAGRRPPAPADRSRFTTGRSGVLLLS
jgi:hypothetical protein